MPAPGTSAEDSGFHARWVGSASVPGSMGYTAIGILLAVMEVGDGILKLRVRPALLRLMFGIENLSAAADPGTMIFPARKFGQIGIEIRPERLPPYYFWTAHRNDVLPCLAGAGFRVSTDEQAMSYRSANRALTSARGTK